MVISRISYFRRKKIFLCLFSVFSSVCGVNSVCWWLIDDYSTCAMIQRFSCLWGVCISLSELNDEKEKKRQWPVIFCFSGKALVSWSSGWTLVLTQNIMSDWLSLQASFYVISNWWGWPLAPRTRKLKCHKGKMWQKQASADRLREHKGLLGCAVAVKPHSLRWIIKHFSYMYLQPLLHKAKLLQTWIRLF